MTFTTKHYIEGSGLYLHFTSEYKEAVIALGKRSNEKHNGYLTVSIGTPKKPRTTGFRSQNSKVWGMVHDIVNQLTAGGAEDVDEKYVYEAFKRMAVQEGYPSRFNPIDGKEEPESQSLVSVEQDMILISVIMKFADENNFYLTEYDENGLPIKVVGGKK